jgi:membrane protease subunit HflK
MASRSYINVDITDGLQLPQLPKLPFTKLLYGFIAFLVMVCVFTSFYTVPTDSVAVVQRFGAYLDTAKPGLHGKIPFGVDTVEILPVERQLKLEFGFATRGGTNFYQFSDEYEQEKEKEMVTGDLNMALVEWSVQYRIGDARQFLYEFADPTSTLRDLSESVMREVVGDRTVDELLTVGRQEVEATALKRMQEVSTQLAMGLTIDQVQLGNVNPPQPVQASFNEVNNAQQEKETAINQANGEYNRVIPRAKGEAEQKISAAEGYATKRINEADGDAQRFTALLKEYEKAPEVTRKRIYLESMGELLPTLPNKIIVDDKAPQLVPLMNLKQNPPVPQQ